MNDEINTVLKEIRLRKIITRTIFAISFGICLGLLFGLPLQEWFYGSIAVIVLCYLKAQRTELKLISLAQRASLMHRV